MSSTPPLIPPVIISVPAMIASIRQQNITGVRAPPPGDGTGTQFNFGEEETGFEPATSEMMLPFKSDQEGGLGTYVLPGGGVPRQCHW
jgi:hypothetical protein